jgi:hypothetical protein
VRGPRLGNWLDRPGYVAIAAFVAGAAIAGIVVAIILTRGGGSNEKPGAQTTATALATGTPTPAATGTPTAATTTPTPGRFRSPPDALAAFVQQQFGQTYLGPCPPGGQPPPGICSKSLYESDQLATYFVGPPLSEAVGEAVLTVAADGAWSVDYVQAAVAGASLAVGSNAVVYGAGDCLNFHPEASTGSQPPTCQLDGTKARVADGPVQADGKTWWKLAGFGWASAEFLQPAQ